VDRRTGTGCPLFEAENCRCSLLLLVAGHKSASPPNWGENGTKTRNSCTAGSSSPSCGAVTEGAKTKDRPRRSSTSSSQREGLTIGITRGTWAAAGACSRRASEGPGTVGPPGRVRRRRYVGVAASWRLSRRGAARHSNPSRVVAAAVGGGIKREPGIGSQATLLDRGERPNRGDGPRPRHMDRNRSERQGPRTVVLFRRWWFLPRENTGDLQH
jgi:hypothetical protein